MTPKKKTDQPKTFSYTLLGEPLPATTVNNTAPHIWNSYKQAKFNAQMALQNQHGYTPFFTGPLHLNATFYFKATPKYPANQNHHTPPTIFKLLNFIDHTLLGTVYKKDCVISKITIQKMYDAKPRTEITITRLT